ncbi:hypothetical protein AC579_1595 [Pseudocercospora musae]|uniref:Uncharacterized protein n=1 Tax=Pseudocercospora musae TaxID=113226 RepID=A0A139HMA3_9PEZI|nr:hypothetical protein AC579_1595 [Pseudocercospora musae]
MDTCVYLNTSHAINGTSLSDFRSLSNVGKFPVLTPAEATAERLKAFSYQFIQEVVNEKNVDSPLFDILDDDFIRRQQDHRQALLRISRTLPDYHAEVLTCAAKVDERGGVATVSVTFKQSGWSGQTIRETISQVTWKRRRESGWTCRGYSGMDWED